MSAKKPQRNGKLASTTTMPVSKPKALLPSRQLVQMLKGVFTMYQRYDDAEKNKVARRDFAFHMSDWEHDVEELAALYRDPDKYDMKSAGQIVFGFVIHAVPHLMEASRLLGEFHDTFAETKEGD